MRGPFYTARGPEGHYETEVRDSEHRVVAECPDEKAADAVCAALNVVYYAGMAKESMS